MKSYFVITIGPAGSGKGYIIEKLVNYINTNMENERVIDIKSFEYGRIDDYIEMDIDYIKASMTTTIEKILKNNDLYNYVQHINDIESCINEFNKNDNILQSYNNNELLKQLDNLSQDYANNYFNIRKKYNAINDANINVWLHDRRNIVFETTGSFNFDWMFTDENFLLSNGEVRKDYNIIVVYPYVDTYIILGRALGRFVKRVNDMLNNGIDMNTIDNDEIFVNYANKIKMGNTKIKFEAPRLPALVKGNYSILSSINAIQKNIAEYINKCNNNVNNNINRLLIYDNQTSDPILSMNLQCINVNLFSNCNILENFNKKYKHKLSIELVNAINNIYLQHCNNLHGGFYEKYLKYKKKYNTIKK